MTHLQHPVKILLVDDREDSLITLCAVLGRTHFDLHLARSGPEALSLATKHDFAVILLDVQMPGMDGFETAEKLRSGEATQRVPIIFVTAINKDERYVFRGYEAGAVDYLFKPFDPLILLSKVRVFTDLYLQRKQLEDQAMHIAENEKHQRFLHVAQVEIDNLRRYRNLADAIPHIVCRANSDREFDYFNKGWTDFTGLTLEDSVGDGWKQALHPEDVATFMNCVTSDQDQAECRIRHHNGEFRWHLIKGSHELDAQGAIVAWLGTATDVHDHRQVTAELAQAKVRAEQANLAKSRFLANMSHEIRTPLSAILGFAEILSHTEPSLEEVHQSANTICKNGRQLLNIIDEILDLSKVEAGRMEVEILQVDLQKLMIDMETLMSMQSAEKGLALKFKVCGQIPRYISTDPTRLRQVLINMIGNAIKFTEKGTVEVELEFLAPNTVCWRITDTGVGIPVEKQHRLFQVFSQIDSSTTRKFGGTGLGLALANELAQILGGQTRLLQSAMGKGTTFEVTISTGQIQSKDVFTSLDVQTPGERGVPFHTPDLKGSKILLADDASDNQVLLKRFLGLAGAQVEVVGDGQAAVEAATHGDYDVILMDIQMPVLDGYEATTQLRSQGYRKPILALTAHALRSERERSLNAGCDDHLTKPIDRRNLLETIARYTSHARLQ